MKTEKIMAAFQFVNNKVVEFLIQNKLLSKKGETVKIDAGIDYEIIDCNKIKDGYLGVVDFIVDLRGKTEEDELFNIHLKMRGNFVGSGDKLTIDKFREMLEVNGTATLSQISRAYIISVTSLSGMHPVNLPMINIYEMKKHKDKSSDDTSH
ncbi:MAG: preprotein translocase subunit SecB [Alkaliphilus sp.]|nr:preprotein translocase subunit SecB [Alkaliphilus sp.]